MIKLKDNATIEETLKEEFSANEHDLSCLRWSGFFDDEVIGLNEATPAQITERILMKKWNLNPGDKDMIVMWHRCVYEHEGIQNEIQSSLIVKGENEKKTAMAKTVGLPLAIATELLIEGKISQRGVCIPTLKEFYEPVLDELKRYGIDFKETNSVIRE